MWQRTPKPPHSCPFSYNLTFILFLNLALIWADDCTPGIDSWIYTNLPLSSTLFFFFLILSYYPLSSFLFPSIQAFLHLPSTSAFPYIIPNRDRFRMGDIWAMLCLISTHHRLSCKGSSFVLINSVSQSPAWYLAPSRHLVHICCWMSVTVCLWFHYILNFQITKTVSWVQSRRSVSENCTRRIWCMVHLEEIICYDCCCP